MPELVLADGEAIVEKRYGDSFADTDLQDRLAQMGANSVVLCGAQTDACIRSTFYGGIYRGYPVTLVTDAHTTEDMREWGVGLRAAPGRRSARLRVRRRHPDLASAPRLIGPTAWAVPQNRS